MWEDPILQELHQIREEHAKSFNYDFKAIFADWKRKESENGTNLVSLQSKQLKDDRDQQQTLNKL